ncbi:TetR/AcrR family transcriptional regulator C-terminal domain-containing protein [Streptomyces sp. WAC06614]|uniref:TetR/AcrR family transcriptional regulator n=1 Tax=Streptomyces sp. WAC06614 TaxID=2487416 RepID=UPI0028AAB426|nr:TetR/AcrR family transcriptional regulator C-terminal domain-containing protein [Streptomyces sp. WAC06614]
MEGSWDDVVRREPLSRERVLRAAVRLADEVGIDTLSMRRLAQELGVVPMALYKHVAHKDELLDGMVDLVVGGIEPPVAGGDWQPAVRRRILAARRALLGHPWAAQVVQSRGRPTPAVLAYVDSLAGMFRAGGFSVDLTHHALHALGSRMLGFTQELFDDSAPAPSRRTAPG